MSVYVKYYDYSKLDEFLCMYFVILCKGVGFMVGFFVVIERFWLWGLIFLSYFENIFVENGCIFIILKNFNGVLLFVYFMLNDKDFYGMCVVENKENEFIVYVYVFECGVFMLNIFGCKVVDSKFEFLCFYVIKVFKGVSDNLGFF